MRICMRYGVGACDVVGLGITYMRMEKVQRRRMKVGQ